jgi:hypothetical protein
MTSTKLQEKTLSSVAFPAFTATAKPRGKKVGLIYNLRATPQISNR